MSEHHLNIIFAALTADFLDDAEKVELTQELSCSGDDGFSNAERILDRYAVEYRSGKLVNLQESAPRVAQPNYAALGLGSAEEAEGRS